MRSLFILFAVSIMLISISANCEEISVETEIFESGNNLYKEKKYDSAIAVYNSLLEGGMESAALHYNIGNAYFKFGDLGNAILSYLRAQRLSPSDLDISENLEFAKRFTSVQMEGVRLDPINSLLRGIVAPYKLNNLAWFSTLVLFILMIFLSLRYGLGMISPVIKTGIILSLILLSMSSLLTSKKYNYEYMTQRGVIIAPECIVRTGPSELSDKELDAAPGLIIEILSETGDYYNVLFENKRRGWVLKSLIAVV